MTTRLHFTLLGAPQIFSDDRPLIRFATSKAQALLIYLAVTGQTHRRDTLANLLWSDTTDRKARKNLRDALSNLRKLVAPYLTITRQTVTFNLDSAYAVDVTQFQTVLQTETTADPELLQAALDLYRGEFLEGFHVRDAPAFEEWVSMQREWLHGLAIQGWHTLSNHYATQGEAGRSRAIEATAQLLALEPWREESHRQMMELLARAGQRSAALAQYETCRRILAEALGTEPMPETTALYERLKSADTTPPHNLPMPANRLIGREPELAQLKQYLAHPTTRLVTIVGPGGVGKSRLALEAAVARTTLFLHGAFFISLAPLQTADYLVPSIAETLGVTFQGSHSPTAQLLTFLSDKEMLLILDNFEHVMSGVGLLIQILAQAPTVKLLVTSRERLNLQEEWVLALKGLVCPSEDAGEQERDRILSSAAYRKAMGGKGAEEQESSRILSRTAAEKDAIEPEGNENLLLAQSPNLPASIALFVERAQRIKADFELTEANRPVISRICHLVEGLPLGIELAAGWLGLLSCTEIAAEIEQNLDFLETSLRNVPGRHRSMRAVFDHSWVLLSTMEKNVYAKLSIFRGGFQRHAAQHVAGATLPTLAGLADKSLLIPTTPGRYELHELLRQYAAEKLESHDLEISHDFLMYGGSKAAIPSARLRHSLYFMEFLSKQDEALHGDQPQQAVAEIKADLDNIRFGWYWCVTNPVVWNWALSVERIDQIEQGIGSLAHFYDLTGLFQEGIDGFQTAAERIEALLADGHGPPTATQRILSKLRLEQAQLLNQAGQYTEALRAARAAVRLAQTTETPSLEAAARHQAGKALVGAGQYQAAQTELDQALALARQAEQARLEAKIWRRLGIIASNQSDHLRAQAAFEQALMIVTQANNVRGQSLVLNNLGVVAKRQGDYVAAQAAYQEALRCFRQTEDVWGESLVLNNLGTVAYSQGRYGEALRHYQQSLRLSHELGDRTNKGIVLENLGELYTRLGAYPRARDYYEQSLRLRRAMKDRYGQAQVWAGLALLQHDLGDDEAAYQAGQRADRLAQAVEAQSLQARALTYIGHALVPLERYAEAVATYQRALAVCHPLGQPTRLPHIRAGLAQAWLAQGEVDLAQEQIEAILPHIQAETLPQLEEPFRLSLICYRLLLARQDDRAPVILDAAARLLHTQADHIEDDTLRRSFLENVPAHQEIRRAVQST